METAAAIVMGLFIIAMVWGVSVTFGKPAEETQVVEVPWGPNDLLVIESPGLLSHDQVARIQAGVKEALDSGVSVMVLDRGLTVKVLHR